MEPLEGLKKIRDELVKSLELDDNETLAVPRLSAADRRDRLQQLREVEAAIRRVEKL